MDINATAKELIIALLDGDRDLAIELAEAMTDWLDLLQGAMPDKDRLLSDLERVLETQK